METLSCCCLSFETGKKKVVMMKGEDWEVGLGFLENNVWSIVNTDYADEL
jgi:hypothetical protein